MRWLKKFGGAIGGFLIELLEQVHAGQGIDLGRCVLKALQGELAVIIVAGLGRLAIGIAANFIAGVAGCGWAGAIVITAVSAYSFAILLCLSYAILEGSEQMIDTITPYP
jgi:hypothetical protein